MTDDDDDDPLSEAGRRRRRPQGEGSKRVESTRSFRTWRLDVRDGHRGVACNDSHASHEHRKAISRRSERIGGRFVETQEIEPPEVPA